MSREPKLTNTTPNFWRPAKSQNPLLQTLGTPHIDSFNYFLEEGLATAINEIYPIQFSVGSGDKIKFWIESAQVREPLVPDGTLGVKNRKIFPTECRQRGYTYKGLLTVKMAWSVNGKSQPPIDKDLGEIPIMVKSNKCHLNGMNPTQLVAHKEHEEEWGGYFVVKGHEKLIRMLLMTRRNYPIAVRRSGWKQRGSLFSDLGIYIRCVRDDNTAVTNTLHYVTDGTVKLAFSHRKFMYYIPLLLILKCLMDVPDIYIYKALTAGCEDDKQYHGYIANMMRAVKEDGLITHDQCKAHIGKLCRVKFYEVPADAKDSEICDFIIKYCIGIHLDDPADKFQLLVHMTKKLFAASQEKCVIEGVDAVMMQECLLGGHLYLQIIKEKISTWLSNVRFSILKRAKTINNYTIKSLDVVNAMKYSSSLENAMGNFMATGNIRTDSGLGLMQTSGLTIVAENINRMRYMSHFRAIHRGSFFTEMRTTEHRKLLPDAWGFICPVHTPDGTPCGLLNHLTMSCIITKHPDKKLKEAIPDFLLDLGMLPLSRADDWKNSHSIMHTIMLDGKIIGLIEDKIVARVVDKLRVLKINSKIPPTTEIVLVLKKNVPAQYPGLYLFTGPTRMMRPVQNLSVKKIELIGTFEQVYLDICIKPEEAHEGLTTHQELSKTSFLSNLACLIPMPDNNQSPRNMYQCQMGKQTMGTPCHNWLQQSGTKLYRLQTPATPLFRPIHHDDIGLDNFAMGTNAIVAVISYTGYDMEDAMIINKASYDRGFAHGMIYKSEFVDLKEQKDYFARDPNNKDLEEILDPDGLPNPGTKLEKGTIYYSYWNSDQNEYTTGKYNGKEEVYVDNVKLCGTLHSHIPRRACITYRIPRNPSIGDKFASRAGQKGICSQMWPQEDLPVSETGLVPDIIFNPHGFPSRMTIAMMIEIMAGKSASIHGLVHDATPFRYSEEDTAVEYFGKLLEAGGYNYYGTERMYSGVTGTELQASIFMGVVHYQRLRHMVSDKWQVRSTGPIDALTRQPIKGRRRGGGVRFGEMERDSLISHACPFLLQDRLFHCSDEAAMLICQQCGTLLGPGMELSVSKAGIGERKIRCRMCDNDHSSKEIDLPYIFRYLVYELASCNIKVKLDIEEK